jgi:Arc/MetJ family transcription regulator
MPNGLIPRIAIDLRAHLRQEAPTPQGSKAKCEAVCSFLTQLCGAGFTRAFATTADELSAILEARAIAGAKAESARSAVHMMLAIMGVILLMLLSSPVQREGFAHPTAQLVTAASLTAMAVGYMVLNGMIEEALD